MLLRTEVAGLDEIGNAPEVKQAVFQWRAGEGQALGGLELLHRLGDLRGRILDELGLIQDDCAKGKLLQRLQVPPQERVVRDD